MLGNQSALVDENATEEALSEKEELLRHVLSCLQEQMGRTHAAENQMSNESASAKQYH